MADENNLCKDELENLRNEMLSSIREEYLCATEIFETLLEISKNINTMMQVLHETLSEREGLFSRYFVGEKQFEIKEALKPEEIDRLFDTISSIIDEVSTMDKYTATISDDIGRVIETDED